MKNGLIIDSLGTKRWYKDDKLHRDDGPAIEWPNGSKEWYLNGKQVSESDLSIITINGKRYKAID